MKLISDDKTSKALYEAYLALVKEMEEDSPKEAASFKETFLPDKKLAQSYATLPTAADDSAHYQLWVVQEPELTTQQEADYAGHASELTVTNFASVPVALSYGMVSYTDQAYPNPLNFEASHSDIATDNDNQNNDPFFLRSHNLVEGPAIAECQFCYHKYASRSNKTCPKCGAVNPNLRKRKHEQRQQQK